MQWLYKEPLKIDKKADDWKIFQNEMEDKEIKKKRRTLLHFLLVFRLAAQSKCWQNHIHFGLLGALGQFGETSHNSRSDA